MNNKQTPSNRRKSAAVGLVICFVAAIALVGTYTFKHYKDGVKQELAKAEEESKKLNKEKEKENSQTANSIIIDNQKEKEDTSAAAEAEKQTEAPKQTDTQSTANQAKDVSFSESDTLKWPISGDVVLNYSMDKTVYFATLDQYKYNPALIIGGQTGEQVITSIAGVVTSIDQSAQTGTTVTMDIGNGYTLSYGQLKDVSVQQGAYVGTGEVLGTLNDPTKYYSVEGCNLYFAMQKDGSPVNPVEFLEQ